MGVQEGAIRAAAPQPAQPQEMLMLRCAPSPGTLCPQEKKPLLGRHVGNCKDVSLPQLEMGWESRNGAQERYSLSEPRAHGADSELCASVFPSQNKEYRFSTFWNTAFFSCFVCTACFKEQNPQPQLAFSLAPIKTYHLRLKCLLELFCFTLPWIFQCFTNTEAHPHDIGGCWSVMSFLVRGTCQFNLFLSKSAIF